MSGRKHTRRAEGDVAIDGHGDHGGHAELACVADVALHVAHALLEELEVLRHVGLRERGRGSGEHSNERK